MFYNPANRLLVIHVWEWNSEDLIIDTIQRLTPKVFILDCTTEFNFNPNIETQQFKEIVTVIKEHKIEAFLLLGSLSENSYRFNFNNHVSPFKVKFFPTFLKLITDLSVFCSLSVNFVKFSI